MSKLNKQILTDLQGQIERITYTNEENGFTIARVKVYNQRDLVILRYLGNVSCVEEMRWVEIFMDNMKPG